MAGTLTTVSKIAVGTGGSGIGGSGGRRLLVRGNRVFVARGETGDNSAFCAYDVDTATGKLSSLSNGLSAGSWTDSDTSGWTFYAKHCPLLTSWDLMSQPKTVISTQSVHSSASDHSHFLSIDLSNNNLSSAVINSYFLRARNRVGHFTCRPDGLVVSEGQGFGFNDGRLITVGNVLTNTVWKDKALANGGYGVYWMHPSQPYAYACHELESPDPGGSGVRGAEVYNFSGTSALTLAAYRLDTTGIGDGASLYTNHFHDMVPSTPDPASNVPLQGFPSLQPWPGHPDYLITFFNRKTPGTTPEVQAWIGFMNISNPLSITFDAAVLVSGAGSWVANRSGEVLAHTAWSDDDGTYAFLRVVENGVERLLKVHVETGIPHDSWSFDPPHYPPNYFSPTSTNRGLRGEFVTEAGWYGTMYYDELHTLGRINGAPKKFYYPTHWSSILRAGR